MQLINLFYLVSAEGIEPSTYRSKPNQTPSGTKLGMSRLVGTSHEARETKPDNQSLGVALIGGIILVVTHEGSARPHFIKET
jgi:hypothetical protein